MPRKTVESKVLSSWREEVLNEQLHQKNLISSIPLSYILMLYLILQVIVVFLCSNAAAQGYSCSEFSHVELLSLHDFYISTACKLPWKFKNSNGTLLRDCKALIDSSVLLHNQNSPCVDRWLGISCYESPNHICSVQTLNLYNMTLSGTIPPSIGNFAYMSSLVLWKNRLFGSIPKEISRLNRTLTLLDLSENLLVGAIPKQFGELHLLESMYLEQNQLSGSISSDLKNMINLKIFSAYGNQLTGTIPDWFPSMKNLSVIRLSGNQIHGTLPVSLCTVPHLQYLYLSANRITGTLPTCYPSMKNLIKLYLGENALLGTLPTIIGNSTKLLDFAIYSNQFHGTLPKSLGLLPSIQILWFSDNSFTGKIPIEYGQLLTLTGLYLDNNHLTGTLPSLPFLSSIVDIQLNGNTLSGTLPTTIPFTNMLFCNLSYNSFTGTIPPTILGNKLRALFLQYNAFSGTLPTDNISQFRNIFLWDLSNNRLHGTIPAVYGTMLTSMKYFMVANNHLLGTLPSSLGALSAASMDLSYNAFTGTIPLSYQHLYLLVATKNQLTGTFPFLLYNATTTFHDATTAASIQYFIISHNYLHGNLSAISSLPPMTNIAVIPTMNAVTATTVMTSTTTSPPAAISTIRTLDISHNAFTGSISSLRFLSSLQMLSLSGNAFTGTIDHIFSSFQNLAYFDISNNNLYGNLTFDEFSNKPRLTTFNIANNNIQGNLLHWFVTTNHFARSQSSLQTFDISGNLITGIFPAFLFQQHPNLRIVAAIRNCMQCILPPEICNASTTLQVLALDGMGSASKCQKKLFPFLIKSNPNASDFAYYSPDFFELRKDIPLCIFSSIHTLETLHLTGNALIGNFPYEINISTALTDLSLSYNSLTGSIPKQMRMKYWKRLDLSNNKFSGTLAYEGKEEVDQAFALQNEFLQARSKGERIELLSLRVNRISGAIPKGILVASEESEISGDSPMIGQLEILEGNKFSCADITTVFTTKASSAAMNNTVVKVITNALPTIDHYYEKYHCVSSQIHDTLIYYVLCFAYLLLLILIIYLIYYFQIRNMNMTTMKKVVVAEWKFSHDWKIRMKLLYKRLTLYQHWYTLIDDTCSNMNQTVFTPHTAGSFYLLSQSFRHFKRILYYITAYIVFILLPTYSILSIYFSTISVKSLWVGSIGFLHGIIPSIVLFGLFIFAFLMIAYYFVLYYLPDKKIIASIKPSNMASNKRLKHLKTLKKAFRRVYSDSFLSMKQSFTRMKNFMKKFYQRRKSRKLKTNSNNVRYSVDFRRGGQDEQEMNDNDFSSIYRMSTRIYHRFTQKELQQMKEGNLIPPANNNNASSNSFANEGVNSYDDDADSNIPNPSISSRRLDVDPTSMKETNSRNNISFQAVWTRIVFNSFWILRWLFFLINIAIISMANVAYVYLTKNLSKNYYYSLIIGMSIFKIVWTKITIDGFILLFKYSKMNFQEYEAVKAAQKETNDSTLIESPRISQIVYFARHFFPLLATLIVFKDIIAPCLATMIFDANCFENVIVASEPIVVSYSQKQSLLVSAYYTSVGNFYIEGDFHIDHTTTNDYYLSPPFIYSYQCATTILEYYVPVMISRYVIVLACIIGYFLILLSQELLITTKKKNNGHRGDAINNQSSFTCMRIFGCLFRPLLPAFLQLNILTITEDEIIADVMIFLLDLILAVVVLFTFGIAFPVLGMILLITMGISMAFYQFTFGRFCFTVYDLYETALERILYEQQANILASYQAENQKHQDSILIQESPPPTYHSRHHSSQYSSPRYSHSFVPSRSPATFLSTPFDENAEEIWQLQHISSSSSGPLSVHFSDVSVHDSFGEFIDLPNNVNSNTSESSSDSSPAAVQLHSPEEWHPHKKRILYGLSEANMLVVDDLEDDADSHCQNMNRTMSKLRVRELLLEESRSDLGEDTNTHRSKDNPSSSSSSIPSDMSGINSIHESDRSSSSSTSTHSVDTVHRTDRNPQNKDNLEIIVDDPNKNTARSKSSSPSIVPFSRLTMSDNTITSLLDSYTVTLLNRSNTIPVPMVSTMSEEPANHEYIPEVEDLSSKSNEEDLQLKQNVIRWLGTLMTIQQIADQDIIPFLGSSSMTSSTSFLFIRNSNHQHNESISPTAFQFPDTFHIRCQYASPVLTAHNMAVILYARINIHPHATSMVTTTTTTATIANQHPSPILSISFTNTLSSAPYSSITAATTTTTTAANPSGAPYPISWSMEYHKSPTLLHLESLVYILLQYQDLHHMFSCYESFLLFISSLFLSFLLFDILGDAVGYQYALISIIAMNSSALLISWHMRQLKRIFKGEQVNNALVLASLSRNGMMNNSILSSSSSVQASTPPPQGTNTAAAMNVNPARQQRKFSFSRQPSAGFDKEHVIIFDEV